MGGAAAYGIYEASGLLIPMTFLKFSRDQEAEADYLGVQYMYKTGYDPNAFVDFFEKIETLEKRKPGTVSKLFSTHPPTDNRIVASQKQIATLKAKPEYVVTTSEFNDVKLRLAMLENQRRPDKANADPNKPTLRRNPNSTTPIEDETDPSKKSSGDDSDRPKLKRRPSDGSDTNTSTNPPEATSTSTNPPPSGN
jgi:predicted Zn-dependent protease